MNKKLLAQKMTYQQFKRTRELQNQIQPGDIMLSSTSDKFYCRMRSLLGVEFDHLSVFIDQENVVHISWPKVRIVHPVVLIAKSTKYKIVRPQFENINDRTIFLNLLKSSLDAKYDYKQLMKAIFNKIRLNYFNYSKDHEYIVTTEGMQLQKTKVCTDLIFYALSIASSRFKNILSDQINFLDYRLVGSFSTGDLDILVKSTTFFKIVDEYEHEKHNQTLEEYIKNTHKYSYEDYLLIQTFIDNRKIKENIYNNSKL